MQIPVLKSRASTRQLKLLKDGQEEGSAHDLQQWLKRKPSVWQCDNLIPSGVDKVILDKYRLVENIADRGCNPGRINLKRVIIN